MELPIEYPSELAVLEVRQALSIGREMLRQVGLRVPQRIRKGSPSSSVRGALVTYTEEEAFIHRLRVACDKSRFALLVEEGRPVCETGQATRKTPLVLVRLRLEFPLDVKVEGLVQSTKQIIQKSREVLEGAGLNLGVRLRPSTVIPKAGQLRLDVGRLVARKWVTSYSLNTISSRLNMVNPPHRGRRRSETSYPGGIKPSST
jgi:hypothetical protein